MPEFRLEKDIHTELKEAISGNGHFHTNLENRKLFNVLSNKFGMELDELVSECFKKYQEEQWIFKYDPLKSSPKWFLVRRVNYALHDLIKRERFFHEKVPVRPFSNNNWISDVKLNNLTDGVTPLTTIIDRESYTELYDELCSYLGKNVVEGLLDGKNRKKVAIENGINPSTLRTKIQRLKKKFRWKWDKTRF